MTKFDRLDGYYMCKHPKECIFMDMQRFKRHSDCCRKLKEMDLTWRIIYCHPETDVKECKFFKPRKGQSDLSAFGE